MNDLIHEIKQDLTEERLLNLFTKYKKPLFVFLAAVLLSIAINSWYQSYKLNRIYDDGGQYMIAMNKMRAQSLEQGLEKFAGITSKNTIYSGLAEFNNASYFAFKREYVKANDAFTTIAKNSNYPHELRELAELLSLQISLDGGLIAGATLESRIESFVRDAKIYKFHALELALCVYIKEQNFSKAQEMLNKILTGVSVPDSIKRRAETYSALIK